MAPGVVADLVPGRVDLDQQLGVDLGVQPLDEEGRAEPARCELAEQRRQHPGRGRVVAQLGVGNLGAELDFGRLAEVVEGEAERAAAPAGPAAQSSSRAGLQRSGSRRACSRAQRKWCWAEASRIGKLRRPARAKRRDRGAVSVRTLRTLRDPPGPEHRVVGGELRVAQALGFVEHRHAVVQRPGPGLEVDGDPGDPDAGVEGGDALGDPPAAGGGDQAHRDQERPERRRPAAPELGLEDQADPGPGLERVVGEEPERRAGGEGAAESHLEVSA